MISTTLYSIYTSEITKGLKEEIKMLQYADDIAIYTFNKRNKKEAIELVERNVDILGKNLNDIGLEIKPSKTNVVWFNRDRVSDKIKCNIRGKEIISTEYAKFLGITFDRELNFDEHIKFLKDKDQQDIKCF